MLDFSYRMLVCTVYSMFIGVDIFNINEMNVNASKEESNNLNTKITDKFWFGVIATKYENITSIPPI